MKIQAVCRIEHDGDVFLATKRDLRNAIPQVEAILQAFAVVREAGASIEGAEFNVHALDGSHSDIYFKLYTEEDASDFLAAINEILGVKE